jgi:hypothetical protein
MKYSQNNTVLLWSNDKVVIKTVSSIVNSLNLDLYKAIVKEDLIGVPYFFAIIDVANLDLNFFIDNKDFFIPEDLKMFGIILLNTNKSNKIKIPRGLKKIITTEEVLERDSLKTTILNKLHSAQKNNKNNRHDHDRKIFRLVFMLRELMNNRVLRIEKLCDEFSVSEKTIRRDFDLLNSLGENIVYDKKKRGYCSEYSLHELTQQYE